MGALIESTVRVWRAPTCPRRFRSKRAAYMQWAKDIILAECDCEEDVNWTCSMHSRLFYEDAWACDVCGTPDDHEGGPCLTCEQHGRRTKPTRVMSTARYLRVKARLARWLAWRDRVAT